MKQLRVAALIAFYACGSAAAHATTNLVQNGDFTQSSPGYPGYNTTLPGWASAGYNFVESSSTSTSDLGVTFWSQPNGGANSWNGAAPSGNFIAMDGKYGNGPIFQNVSGFTVGDQYTLSFNYAFGQQYGFDGATVQSMAATIGSTSWDSGDYDLSNHGFSGWTQENLTFTATSASEQLTFLATGNLPVPPFGLVSGVSITEDAAAPPPAGGGADLGAPGPTPGAGFASLALVALLLAAARTRGAASTGQA